MPQGRRKIPFSGKQKKQQIVNKRMDKGKITKDLEILHSEISFNFRNANKSDKENS